MTCNEFFEISDELSNNQVDGYWMDLTKFAWLAQYISSMMGGDTKVFEDMLKNPPIKSTPKPSSEKKGTIDEWKATAEKRGLKHQTG